MIMDSCRWYWCGLTISRSTSPPKVIFLRPFFLPEHTLTHTYTPLHCPSIQHECLSFFWLHWMSNFSPLPILHRNFSGDAPWVKYHAHLRRWIIRSRRGGPPQRAGHTEIAYDPWWSKYPAALGCGRKLIDYIIQYGSVQFLTAVTPRLGGHSQESEGRCLMFFLFRSKIDGLFVGSR